MVTNIAAFRNIRLQLWVETRKFETDKMIVQFGRKKTDRAIWWRQPSGKAKRRMIESVGRGFDGDKGDWMIRAIDMAFRFPMGIRAHDHVDFGVTRLGRNGVAAGGYA